MLLGVLPTDAFPDASTDASRRIQFNLLSRKIVTDLCIFHKSHTRAFPIS